MSVHNDKTEIPDSGVKTEEQTASTNDEAGKDDTPSVVHVNQTQETSDSEVAAEEQRSSTKDEVGKDVTPSVVHVNQTEGSIAAGQQGGPPPSQGGWPLCQRATPAAPPGSQDEPSDAGGQGPARSRRRPRQRRRQQATPTSSQAEPLDAGQQGPTSPDSQCCHRATPSPLAAFHAVEKHISIVQSFKELEDLADLHDDVPKCCPLCPEVRFKACNMNKLHRHLQNLHWKISVEHEGYRMCICQLLCSRPLKSEINGEQSTTKMGAHYHCIICADKISRRTDMLSHIKRHISKGETKSKFSAGTPAAAHTQSSEEILKEADTNVQVFPNYGTPQKTDSFFNPKMKTNRQLIFCALAVLAEEKHPLECLDAFGSTGIMGLQWAKHLGLSVKVTINDINKKSVEMIRENCHINKMKVVTDKDEDEEECDEAADESIGSIEVTMQDANVLMHLRAFDFIHLDPFGTTVNFLDAAFRNVRNLGIVSVTSTDISSLYGKTQHVAKRHYGVNIIRTEYFRELAARIVLAAVARAAARCNKGIDVLLSVALEHFVLVVVRVLRGPTEADHSGDKIRTLIHCQWCEERIFQKEGHMVGDSPYRQLPCNCHESMPGKSAIELGPVWSGTIFNNGFLRRMLYESVQRGIDDIQPLLKTLICEAECTTHKQLSITLSQNQEECGVIIKTPSVYMTDEQHTLQGKRKRQEISPKGVKRWKSEARVEHPSFYYSIHRHSIRGMNSPKLNKFLQYLAEAGFLVSRTHFDPLGVRTNATLATFKCILEQHSTTSNTPAAGVTTRVDAAATEETPLVAHVQSDSVEDTENNFLSYWS